MKKKTLDAFFQKQLKLGGYCSDILVNKKKKICMINKEIFCSEEKYSIA